MSDRQLSPRVSQLLALFFALDRSDRAAFHREVCRCTEAERQAAIRRALRIVAAEAPTPAVRDVFSDELKASAERDPCHLGAD